MSVSDPQVQDACWDVFVRGQAAVPSWFSSPPVVEGVRIASLALAAAAAIVGASRETKTNGTPNQWGKILIFIGAIAFIVGGVNELSDWNTKSADSERNHTFQSCEIDHLRALATTMAGVAQHLTVIQNSEQVTSSKLAAAESSLQTEIAISKTVSNNILRGGNPLFPFKVNLELAIEAPKADSVTTKLLPVSPYDALFQIATKETVFPAYAPYLPFSSPSEKLHILPLKSIVPGRDFGLASMADFVCTPDYQIIIDKRPVQLSELLKPDTEVDLRAMTRFTRDRTAPLPSCRIGNAYFTNRLAFLEEQHRLAVSQRFEFSRDNVMVDNHVITSCIDLVGSTLYFAVNMWDVAGLALKGFYWTSCGRVGTPQEISFSPADRHVIDRSNVVYSKILTRQDLGIE